MALPLAHMLDVCGHLQKHAWCAILRHHHRKDHAFRGLNEELVVRLAASRNFHFAGWWSGALLLRCWHRLAGVTCLVLGARVLAECEKIDQVRPLTRMRTTSLEG